MCYPTRITTTLLPDTVDTQNLSEVFSWYMLDWNVGWLVTDLAAGAPGVGFSPAGQVCAGCAARAATPARVATRGTAISLPFHLSHQCCLSTNEEKRMITFRATPFHSEVVCCREAFSKLAGSGADTVVSLQELFPWTLTHPATEPCSELREPGPPLPPR